MYFNFHPSVEAAQKVVHPTIINVAEPSDNGSFVLVKKVIELQENPFAAMSFSDFSVSECLKHGINYHDIQLIRNDKIGMDADIDAFNAHLETISDQLFNLPSNEN